MSPRKHISLRISESADERIRIYAADYGISYTIVVRAALAVAFNHLDELNRTLSTIGKVEQ